jgi:hypothetical protein
LFGGDPRANHVKRLDEERARLPQPRTRGAGLAKVLRRKGRLADLVPAKVQRIGRSAPPLRIIIKHPDGSALGRQFV